MKRRDFITLLGGAAVAWPIAARAQQGERMRRVGVLMNFPADDPESQARRRRVRSKNYRNWAGRAAAMSRSTTAGAPGQRRASPKREAEMLALAPDVIVANGNVIMTPLMEATRTVPIVFANVADPVGAGFVDELARPGGNATGFMRSSMASAASGWSCLRRSRLASRAPP